MQKAFTFKDAYGVLRAGHLEATDEMYRKIIINEENIPLLIVKGYDYYHATPYFGKIPTLPDTWANLIPLKKGKKKILVLGDTSGAHTLGLLLTYGYDTNSKIYYCNPFTHGDEVSPRDGDAMQKLTSEVLLISGMHKKVQVYTEYSRNFLPTLKRAILDIAFVDLNDEPRYLLEDLITLWHKVKEGGFIVINDCNKPIKQKAIASFLECYESCFKILANQNNQMFLLKTQKEAGILGEVEDESTIHDAQSLDNNQ
jgi:hypothetical protein